VRSLPASDQVRISQIPRHGDWRFLANRAVEEGGVKLGALEYRYGKKGKKRFVCPCEDKSSGRRCAKLPQSTIVPAHLAHTAESHNQWAGCYGRVWASGTYGAQW
jgi:DNA (cytosine-5)-methyltransferase 1